MAKRLFRSYAYKRKKRIQKVIAVVMVLMLITLWFTDILPEQVAKGVATHYMSSELNGAAYNAVEVTYSSAQDCYFVYFKSALEPSSERVIGIYYHYFPIDVFYDSYYPEKHVLM